MTVQPQLLRNANFAEWDDADTPTGWQETTTNNVAVTRIQERDVRGATARTVFPRKGPYIYDGGSSFRATFTSAAVAADLTRRQPNASSAGVLCQPLERFSLVVAARCSVPGNLLRVRVIGLVGTTDTVFLEPTGNTASVATNYNPHGRGGFTWNTSTRDIDCTMQDMWTEFGFEIQVPLAVSGVTSLAVRFGNGTAGAQVIDVGAVYLRVIERTRNAE